MSEQVGIPGNLRSVIQNLAREHRQGCTMRAMKDEGGSYSLEITSPVPGVGDFSGVDSDFNALVQSAIRHFS